MRPAHRRRSQPKSLEAARLGLPNSWHSVTILHQGTLIGMGRVIGDGGTAFQITDMAVNPAHQGKGIGKAIMANLVGRLRSHAPKSAHVSLIADGPAQHLYARRLRPDRPSLDRHVSLAALITSRNAEA
ncbi:GNAT family N-acetyltransferase [uncultured Devosia sp.]|uniref:GNAT family N-acetyltransferase n=1 Tax=uncultured Devosia sp. TaxID=211434 RepID=UPI0035CC46E9